MDPDLQAKFNVACARLKARYLEIEASRHRLQTLDKPPIAEKQGAPLKLGALKCKATCLNGQPCRFKASLGGFCSKHYTPPQKP